MRIAGLFLAALLGLSAEAAVTPPAQPGASIAGVTVTAPPKPGELDHERFAQSLNFISSHGATAHIGQLARWPAPVCPIALGLSPEMDTLVTNRVKLLAFEVGAPQARRPGRCKPNIEIVFTDKPQALMDLVAKKRNDLLGFHYVSQEKAVTRIVRPVQAWYLTQTVAGDAGAGNVDFPASIGSAQSLDLGDNHAPAGCAGSAFSECLSSQFVNILVVADANALSGAKIGPVADYIAMICLAQFRTPQTCDPSPTLLDMFTPACAGQEVAQAPGSEDVGYLKRSTAAAGP